MREIRHLLANLGLQEAVTYTLTSPSLVEDYNTFHKAETVALMSPLSEERSVTRKSIIPNLLQVVAYNQAHAQKNVLLFELSKTYAKDEEVQSLALP